MTSRNTPKKSRSSLPFNFPSAIDPVYVIAPDADVSSLNMHFENRLAHLEAMLILTYGHSGEKFREESARTQDNYMWVCSDIATECMELFKQINSWGQA